MGLNFPIGGPLRGQVDFERRSHRLRFLRILERRVLLYLISRAPLFLRRYHLQHLSYALDTFYLIRVSSCVDYDIGKDINSRMFRWVTLSR